MKNGNKTKASWIKVLLGLAAAGALLFASCQNIFDPPGQLSQKGDGKGTVVVDLDDSARTIRPDLGQFNKFLYTFILVDARGNELDIREVFDSTGPSSQAFSLPEGTYKLSVEALLSTTGSTGATGKYKGANGDETFKIEASVVTKITVGLIPKETGDGTLNVYIYVPTGADYVFTLRMYAGSTESLGDPIALTWDRTADQASPGGFNGDKIFIKFGNSRPNGSYQLTGRINTSDAKYGGFSEAVHIVPDMTTTFTKDFLGEDELVQVKTSKDAIDILKDEIDTWLTASETNAKNVLASKETAVTGLTDTIRLNFIAAEQAKLNAPGSFPLTLQGGWAQADDNWQPSPNASSPNKKNWPVVPSEERTYKLVNTAVDAPTNNGVTTYNTRYTLVLRPVAVYRVAYPDGEEGRVFTIANVTLGDPVAGVRTGVGAVGSVNFTVNTDTAVEYSDSITNPAVVLVPTIANGAFTINAVSTIYNFYVYPGVEAQKTFAFNKLKAEIINKDSTPGVTPWLPSADLKGLANYKPQEELPVWPVAPSPTDTQDDIVLYYVGSKIQASTGGTITINTPVDGRWAPGGTTTLSSPTTVTNSIGQAVSLIFNPKGSSEPVTYYVVLKPVAEFIVDFYPETYYTGSNHNADTNNQAWANDKNPNIDSNGNIIIKDSETGNAAGSKTYNTTEITPSVRFSLGSQASNPPGIGITLSGVTIQVDDYLTGGDYKFRNAVSSSGTQNQNSSVVQNAEYKIAAPVSRVYRVNVYPSLEKQRALAVADLMGETNSKLWTIPSGSNNNWTQRIDSIKYATQGQGTQLSNSTIVFVGKDFQVPQVKYPTDGDYTSGNLPRSKFRVVSPSDNGFIFSNGNQLRNNPNQVPQSTSAKWGYTSINQTSTTIPPNSQSGSLDVPLRYTLKGGFEEELYLFKMTRAVEYSVTFAGKPVGIQNASGSISVTGNEPGISNPPTRQPIISNTASGANRPLLAVTPAINFSSSTQNVLRLDRGDYNRVTKGDYVTTMQAITITGGDTRFDLRVYPSFADQVSDMSAALKNVSSLTGWLQGTTTVTAKDATANNLSKTVFQVISTGGMSKEDPSIFPPASFQLNSDYADRLSYTIGTSGTAVDAAKAFRQDTVQFVALGGTSTGGTQQVVTYLFDVYKVARYTVEFMNGPNKSTSYAADLTFRTLKENDSIYLDTRIYTSGSRSFVGGVGTGAKISISSSNYNTQNVTAADFYVFQAGINGTTGEVSAVTAADYITNLAAQTASSGDFVIRVYPSVKDQRAQVVAMLGGVTAPLQNASSSNQNGWFDTITAGNTTFVSTSIEQGNTVSGSDTTPVSLVKYWGSVAPTVKVPSGTTSFLESGYILSKDTQVIDQNYGWKTTKLLFKPKAPNAADWESVVYAIRTVPLVKYNIEFTGGATGRLTIKPTDNNSSVDPKTSIITGSNTTGYLGLDTTNIAIEAAPGGFTDVTVPAFVETTFRLYPAVGNTPAKLNQDLPAPGNDGLKSREYTVRVNKVQ